MKDLLTFALLAYIIVELKEQRKKGEIIIMKIDQVLKQVDDATNAAAQRVQALIDAIKADKGELSPEQQAQADGIVSHLQSIGADPTNPVPQPEPEPQPSGEPTTAPEPGSGTESGSNG